MRIYFFRDSLNYLEAGKIAVKTQAIDFKEALLTIMYTQEALIKLLVRKGIIQEEELLEEIRKIRNKKSVPLG